MYGKHDLNFFNNLSTFQLEQNSHSYFLTCWCTNMRPHLPMFISKERVQNTSKLCCFILSFRCSVYKSLFCPFTLFLLAIVMSVLYGFWLPLWYFQTLLLLMTSRFDFIRTLFIYPNELLIDNYISKYVQQYTSFSCIWCLHLAIDSLCKGQ